MKVIWLNDSLVLRSENPDERHALAVIFESVAKPDLAESGAGLESTEITSPSTA